MNVLFVHNNFPAQFRHLASRLAEAGHIVRAIGATTAPGLPNVAMERYAPPQGLVGPAHSFARHFDFECRRGEQVLFAASALKASGFTPDLVFAHSGWGESIPLRAAFPAARIAIYCEFYYRADGQDVHFDPEGASLGADGIVAMHCRNASTLLALAECDIGVSPTQWQRSTFPAEFQAKIKVAHEGVDTEQARPNERAIVHMPSGRVLRQGAEVVTFVARNLEPTRGYHIFMRALADVLKARPNAEVLIIGGDQTSYGPSSPDGRSWKDVYLEESRDRLDLGRIHFLGQVPRATYLSVLQISSVHVYLTYPFVLSWSVIEAMSVGCRIVASDTAPVREIIDDSNGVLTPFLDASRLAESIVDVLARPADYDGRARRARQTAVARFDQRQSVRRLIRILGLHADGVRDLGSDEGDRAVAADGR
jgi:glycosyltransferase involved in cell wall biosynthesis